MNQNDIGSLHSQTYNFKLERKKFRHICVPFFVLLFQAWIIANFASKKRLSLLLRLEESEENFANFSKHILPILLWKAILMPFPLSKVPSKMHFLSPCCEWKYFEGRFSSFLGRKIHLSRRVSTDGRNERTKQDKLRGGEDWKEAFLSGKHEVGGKNSSFLSSSRAASSRTKFLMRSSTEMLKVFDD